MPRRWPCGLFQMGAGKVDLSVEAERAPPLRRGPSREGDSHVGGSVGEQMRSVAAQAQLGSGRQEHGDQSTPGRRGIVLCAAA